MKKVLFIILLAFAFSCTNEPIIETTEIAQTENPYEYLMTESARVDANGDIVVLSHVCTLDVYNGVDYSIYQDDELNFYLVSTDGLAFHDVSVEDVLHECNGGNPIKGSGTL